MYDNLIIIRPKRRRTIDYNEDNTWDYYYVDKVIALLFSSKKEFKLREVNTYIGIC